jgi:Zn-dependent protease with chaperone function
MKIVNKTLEKTADVSSARGTAWKEFRHLVLSAAVLLIVLYFSLGFIVDLAVSQISFGTEAKIFKHYKLQDIGKKDAEKQDDLNRASTILEKLKADEKIPPLPYHLVLIDHETPNAFAFPGGSIGLSTALLEVLDDDIEVAFVIGHELGHFYNRDHLRGLGKAAGFGIIMTVLFGNSTGSGSFGNMINFVLQRTYSQDREELADRFGLELVYSVYGKVEGTDRLFQIISEKDKTPEWAYMFSSHPSPEQRIDDLEEYARKLK